MVGMAGNALFGDWKGIPRGDDPGAVFVPAPVGQRCVYCNEEIQQGDTGEMMPHLGMAGVEGINPVHRECSLLHIVGHDYGLCSCTDYEGLSEREAALELDKRVAAGARVT